MPVSIVVQPELNQIQSAYKPLLIGCEATTIDGNIPPIVYCDVYINAVYYRTFISTKANKNNQFIFDIQDAVQEKLSFFLPPIDGNKICINNASLIDVFVKIRTAKFNSSGLIESEQIAPIPETEDSIAVIGQGFQSNKFQAINLLIQHEENQDVNALLENYKTNQWNDEALPLTKRHEINYLTNNQCSYFPFLSEKSIKKIRMHVKFKGNSDIKSYEKEIVNEHIEEIQNPPIINIKWLVTIDNSENTNSYFWDLKWGIFPNIKIKFYPEDPDLDIVNVELFKSVDSGSFLSLGVISGNEYNINDLPVGLYQFKAKVYDSYGNNSESNVLRYEVIDTKPAEGTITLQQNETISVIGGTYKVVGLNLGPLNPDGSDLYVYNTNFTIEILDVIKDFYLNKGMDPANLKIKFTSLINYSNWNYNNTLVTNTNYSFTTVDASVLNTFRASNANNTYGTVLIIHQFEIYHTSDPSQVVTNYLQMEFN